MHKFWVVIPNTRKIGILGHLYEENAKKPYIFGNFSSYFSSFWTSIHLKREKIEFCKFAMDHGRKDSRSAKPMKRIHCSLVACCPAAAFAHFWESTGTQAHKGRNQWFQQRPRSTDQGQHAGARGAEPVVPTEAPHQGRRRGLPGLVNIFFTKASGTDEIA